MNFVQSGVASPRSPTTRRKTVADGGFSADGFGNKKPTFRWVRALTPPRSSAVGVISLAAGSGDSMPTRMLPRNYIGVKTDRSAFP